MRIPNFKRSQREVKRIMEEMGKQPAKFGEPVPKEAPKKGEWTVSQILIIMLLTGIMIVVVTTAILIFLDMWQKGMFDYLLR